MSHPPQASLSSSGRADSSLPRPSGSRFDEVAPPRTRSADGRSSEERVTEEQAFERAAAQLRPAWATGQARQYLAAASSSAPISGTTALPPAPEVPTSKVAGPAGEPASSAVAAPVQSAAPSDGDAPDEIELSDAIYEGEPLLDPQPVYAASHSNFPAQPFDVGVTPSTQFRSRHITDDTADFSHVIGKRPLNVRLLAIGAAACLLIGSVWALASGDSPDEQASQGAAAAAAAAAAAQAKPPVAPAPRAPAAAPADLPTGRELPDSLLPSRTRASAVASGAPSSGVDKSTELDSKARKSAVRAPATPANKKASLKALKPTGKVTPTKTSAVSSAPKSKAQPATKTKPQAKPASKSRGRASGVVDPWGR